MVFFILYHRQKCIYKYMQHCVIKVDYFTINESPNYYVVIFIRTLVTDTFLYQIKIDHYCFIVINDASLDMYQQVFIFNSTSLNNNSS